MSAISSHEAIAFCLIHLKEGLAKAGIWPTSGSPVLSRFQLKQVKINFKLVMERCRESLLISRFSKNRWDLERYRYPLEFGTNCEFLAQRV